MVDGKNNRGGIPGGITISKPCLDFIEGRKVPAELAAISMVRELVAAYKANGKFAGKSPEQLRKAADAARARVDELDRALAAATGK